MYSYKNEQKKLDEIKWKESVEAGEDKCGSYEYCAVCVKELHSFSQLCASYNGVINQQQTLVLN